MPFSLYLAREDQSFVMHKFSASYLVNILQSVLSRYINDLLRWPMVYNMAISGYYFVLA